MRNLKKISVGIGTLLLSWQCLADPLIFVTEDYPPFNFTSDGVVVGMSTDTLMEMAKRAKLEANVAVYPWKRAMSMAAEEKNTCVFSTIRTPERENNYKWIGPLISDNLALFAKADRDIKLKTLEDARKYSIGTYNGSLAIALLKAQDIPFDIAPDDQSNLEKLAIDRIDLWVASLRTGPFMAKRKGIVNVKPVLTIGNAKDLQMYLACTKTLPDQTVTTLNTILQGMRKDGTLAKIQSKYE